MEKTNWKKKFFSVGIAVMLIGVIFLLSACTSEPEVEMIPVSVAEEAVLTAENAAFEKGVVSGIESIDITSDNQDAIDEYLNSSVESVEEDPVLVLPEAFYEEDYSLGDDLESVLDDTEVEVLFDGKVSLDGNDVDVKELIFLTEDVQFAYSGNAVYDEDFAAEPYLVALSRDAVGYALTFEDEVSFSDISTETPLYVSFLGKEISIIDADVGQFTYVGRDEHYLSAGTTLEVDGKVVTLMDVGDGSVVVSVDGVVEIIQEGSTETVNGVRVYVESTFSRNDRLESSAVLVLGEDAKVTIDSGEYYNENEMWQWIVSTEGDTLLSVGVVLDEKFNKLDGDVSALALGECLALPEDYLSLCFDSQNDVSYTELNIFLDEIDFEGSDVLVTAVSANDEVLKINDEEVSELYSDGSSIYYKDGHDYVQVAGNSIFIDLGDAEYQLTFGEEGEVMLFDLIGDMISIDSRAQLQSLGQIENDAEATDVIYNGMLLGNVDQDTLTAYGIKILSPEDNADSDEVELLLPNEQLELTFGIY